MNRLEIVPATFEAIEFIEYYTTLTLRIYTSSNGGVK
jgi:hypothetical protein